MNAARSLIEALDSASEGVRAGALGALGVLGYYSIIEPLVTVLAGDESAGVRERAFEVVENLIAALEKVRELYS